MAGRNVHIDRASSGIAEDIGFQHFACDVKTSHCPRRSEEFTHDCSSRRLRFDDAVQGDPAAKRVLHGATHMLRLAGVIQLTDYASVYLAIASGIDPGQAVAIQDLKAGIE